MESRNRILQNAKFQRKQASYFSRRCMSLESAVKFVVGYEIDIWIIVYDFFCKSISCGMVISPTQVRDFVIENVKTLSTRCLG